jgi:hydrogenase maturation protease
VRPLIVGVGNRWRGDDGVGPRAVDAIGALGRDDVDVVVLDGEPARLVTAWTGRDCVVVVDAVRTGAPPGTIHHLVGPDAIPAPAAGTSTHGGGVAAAVELARALGTLPGHLVVVGVEPAATRQGDGLSPIVDASLDAAVARVLKEVRRACV